MATSSISTPSLVTVGFPIYCSNSFFSFKNWSLFAVYSAFFSSEGAARTTPSLPSTIISAPSSTCPRIPGTATTAGISRARARIALWEVLPPISVTIPATFAGLIPAVIDGVKSFATITLPSGSAAISTGFTPCRTCWSLTLISLISVALCCISSSSMDANISAYIVQTVSIANSLHTLSPVIALSISLVSIGSFNSIRCPCMISASFSPTLVARSAANVSVCAIVSANAPLKRSTSAAPSITFSGRITSSFSLMMAALPMPIPADAFVPLNIMLSPPYIR